jgi:glutamyl-tRNA synthetase
MSVPSKDTAPRPVGRLAPSPTGALHLGHARTFLIAYWSVRSRGGKLVLRIEDLDVDRARPEFIDDARRDLEWLGLDWDEERVQSTGLERLRAAVDQLSSNGRAFPCTCSRADVRNALSAPHGPELAYPGTCRDRYANLDAAERQSGKPAGLRFRVEDREFAFDDGLLGRHAENLGRASGDFSILRRDRLPAYHLAVVVDDAFDGVTEVVRGSDLLASTPKHLALYDALGHTPPRYYHVPLVTDEHGVRLAKRAPRLSLLEFREGGTDPRRIVKWVAASVGIELKDLVSTAELSAAFSFERLPHDAVTVAQETLSAFRD